MSVSCVQNQASLYQSRIGANLRSPLLLASISSLAFSLIAGFASASQPKSVIEPIEITDFEKVPLGSILFVAHQHNPAHVAIAAGQKMLGSSASWIDVVHTGIVAKKKSSSQILSYEIPDRHSVLSEVEYSKENLKPGTELFFFDPSQIIPEKERDAFRTNFLQTSKNLVERTRTSFRNIPQYNIQGLLSLPFQRKCWTKKDWNELVTRVFLHTYNSSDIQVVPEARKYYCSEFIMDSIQQARMLQKNPNLVEALHPAEDPFFFAPARIVTPAMLLEKMVGVGGQLFRIAIPQSSKSPFLNLYKYLGLTVKFSFNPSLSSTDECPPLAKIENRFRYSNENLSPSCIIKNWIEESGDEVIFSYNKNFFYCILEKMKNKGLDKAVADCIEDVFTIREKLGMVFSSVAINYFLDEWAETGNLERALDLIVPAAASKEVNISELIEILFPTKTCGMLNLTCLRNRVISYYLNNHLREEDVLKFAPLGFLGMPAIFEQVGLECSPPFERIKTILQNYALKKISGTL